MSATGEASTILGSGDRLPPDLPAMGAAGGEVVVVVVGARLGGVDVDGVELGAVVGGAVTGGAEGMVVGGTVEGTVGVERPTAVVLVARTWAGEKDGWPSVPCTLLDPNTQASTLPGGGR